MVKILKSKTGLHSTAAKIKYIFRDKTVKYSSLAANWSAYSRRCYSQDCWLTIRKHDAKTD